MTIRIAGLMGLKELNLFDVAVASCFPLRPD